MWQHKSTHDRLEELENKLSSFFRGTPASGGADHQILHLLKHMEIRLMSALDDLKSAIADLATELADNNAEIESLLAKITTPGATEADIAAAAQSIRDLTSANKAEVEKARAAAG